MHLWDTRTGAHIKTLTGDDQTSWVYSLAFSPDSTTLASGTHAGVQLWDVVTGQSTTAFAGGNVTSIAFSPNGDLLASGGSDIWLWDVATGQLVATLTGHTGVVNSVAFSPDGDTLASGSRDGTVLLWDLQE